MDSVRSQLSSYSAAYGINNHDEIVGTFGSYETPRAFLFANGKLFDLNQFLSPSSDLTLIAATGINDEGDIVGYATDGFGNTVGFHLSANPVPEPTTLAVFGCLAFGMARNHLRQRRRD